MIKAANNRVLAGGYQARGSADGGAGPIDQFLDAVWMERGLSPNTLAAYRADLTALARWLEERGSGLLSASRADVLAFMAARLEAGARPRSTARQLSSFRRFFRYLVREGLHPTNPAEAVATPKRNRYLPKTLSVDEATTLLERGHGHTVLALRDRAMLELLYSSGLRVSELTGLDVGGIDLRRRVLAQRTDPDHVSVEAAEARQLPGGRARTRAPRAVA